MLLICNPIFAHTSGTSRGNASHLQHCLCPYFGHFKRKCLSSSTSSLPLLRALQEEMLLIISPAFALTLGTSRGNASHLQHHLCPYFGHFKRKCFSSSTLPLPLLWALQQEMLLIFNIVFALTLDTSRGNASHHQPCLCPSFGHFRRKCLSSSTSPLPLLRALQEEMLLIISPAFALTSGTSRGNASHH